MRVKGPHLVNEVPQRLPPVWADDMRLSRMVSGLVANAIKFTGKGSVTVRAAVEGELPRVEVADTGVGISPADLPKRFQRFGQAPACVPIAALRQGPASRRKKRLQVSGRDLEPF